MKLFYEYNNFLDKTIWKRVYNLAAALGLQDSNELCVSKFLIHLVC